MHLGKTIFLVLIISFLALVPLHAQIKFRIDYYGTESGLSHSMITNIIKDQEGFMWFGTWNGINRFDGKKFVSYKPSPKDKFQLENDRIDQLLDDGHGSIWLRAYDHHIYKFDKSNGRFYPLHTLLNDDRIQQVHFNKLVKGRGTLIWMLSENNGIYGFDPKQTKQYYHFSNKPSQSGALSSNELNFLYEDLHHNIWIGTTKGLDCLFPKEKIYNTITPVVQSQENILRVTEDDKHVYFGAASGNLYIFNKKNEQLTRLALSQSEITSIKRSKVNNVLYASTRSGELIVVDLSGNGFMRHQPALGPFVRIFEDHSGIVWIEPEKKGVIKFDPLTRQFKLIKTEQSASNISASTFFFHLYEDINGVVWINTKDDGFGYYDKNTETIRRVVAGEKSIPFPHFVDLAYYDRAGIFWLKTDQRGIMKITLQPNNFNQQLLKLPEYLRNENDVRTACKDKQNRLWICTKSGDVYISENNIIKCPVFINHSPATLGPIYSIIEDSKGNIWMASKSNGLFKAIPTGRKKLEYTVIHYNKSQGLTSNQLYSIAEDKHGAIWLGSFDGGLMKAVETPAGLQFTKAPGNYPSSGFNKIRYLRFDSFGNLWIATTQGLVIMDGASNPSNPRFITYRMQAGNEQSIGDNDIQYIYEDTEKRVWLATSGGGASLAKGPSIKQLTFKNYTVQDGLANDFVLSIMEGKDGHLWFATENGLSEFIPSAQKFINYDQDDGLPAASFSEATAVSGADGNMFLGMNKGFLSFNPKNFNNNRIAGSIVFTNLQINNKTAEPGRFIEKDINYISKMVLRHNQNIFRLDCALLDYRFTGKELLAYKLRGFDSAWYTTAQNAQITYTNLPPGNYLLEIKTMRYDLYNEPVYRSLPVVVLPAPWKTWWAYTLYTLVALAIIIIIGRMLLTMLQLRHKIELEKRLSELKLNFFTNISHELRTPLTLILGPLEQLAKSEQLSAQGKEHIRLIKKSASRMVHFVNQLLDLRKIQAGSAKLNISFIDIGQIVKKCSEHFLSLAKNKNIHFRVHTPQESLFAYVDAEKIDMIVYNLLSNAFKFTPDGKSIEVILNPVPGTNQFSIVVADEGPGVSPENLSRMFDLFNDVTVSQKNSQVKGTGIGLALCRELTALHKGAIYAARRNRGGLEVTLVIDRYVNKPAEPTIAPVPTYITGDIPANHTKAVNGLPHPRHKQLVLLVEDNPDLNSFLKNQLSSFYTVETAFDGAEGLQKAKTIQPDIIISDVMMPNMDGIEMLDKLKNTTETSHIPVILLTAKSSVESQVKGLNYGADYYITKPFSLDFLIASVKNLIRQRARLFEKMVQRKTVELKPEEISITSKDETFLKKVVKIVSDNMDDPNFNIEAVAAQLNMVYNTFYKKFKSLTNLTPVEFLRDLRLQRAKEYLETGEYTVAEVAYMVGFNHAKYFSTCFKEKYKQSPSEMVRKK